MRQEAIERRTSLWRLPAMQALVGVTSLGFASYCLTLASLPTYAVLGGAPAATAGLVTAVFLLVTIMLQGTLPALTARFGAPRVLVAGLLAMGLPSPLYAVDDGLGWLCALSAVRGAGFAVLTVLGSTLAAQVAPADRRGGAVGRRVERPPSGSGRAAALAAVLPSVVLFMVTMAGGGVVTFLPIERPEGSTATGALLLFGVTAAISRWRAGLLADRLHRRRLVAAPPGGAGPP